MEVPLAGSHSLAERESSEEAWRRVVTDGSTLSIRHGDTDFTAMMVRSVIDELERNTDHERQ